MTINNLRCFRVVFAVLFAWFVISVIFYTVNMVKFVSLESNTRLAVLLKKTSRLESKLTRQHRDGVRLLALLQSIDAASSARLVRQRAADVLPPQHVKQIPVVVMACNRPGAIKTHIDRLIELRPSPAAFPIIVSQDCNHTATARAILAYGSDITFLQQPNLTQPKLPKKLSKFAGYYKIARHYRWTLDQVFNVMNYRVAIITEDDLLLASDFFDYFLATYKLLAVDATLLCVSAWNDNGKVNLIEQKPDLLYRTDFFPGLGWMLIRELWQELRSKWPEGFWDDWLRDPKQRKGRACIRPEISRTGMSRSGKVGVSGGLFFEKHLKSIHVNSIYTNFTEIDLSYLLKKNYDKKFFKTVIAAPLAQLSDVQSNQTKSNAVRVIYNNDKEFANMAKKVNMMEDMKAGVPRTAYYGVVSVFINNVRVYFVPNNFSSLATI